MEKLANALEDINLSIALAFPLLKRLTDNGIPLVRKFLKEEIASSSKTQ